VANLNAPLAQSIAKQLSPVELVASALTLPLAEFEKSYSNTLFLLVKLDDSTGDLESGLVGLRSKVLSSAQAVPNTLGFQTVIAVADHNDKGSASLSELRRRLDKGRHFALTVEKREQDSAYADRISVGRTRNKDIVLRHASVSKFHAWFEKDAQENWWVADAESRNGTRLNTNALPSRELSPVKTGDVLLFGSVEIIVCASASLWKSVRS
jgi:hypothetical protein